MLPGTTARLLDINREFYQNFAGAFASTRRRIQPGVRRVLNEINLQGDWLDIGCGSGALALEWLEHFKKNNCSKGSYLGLDFSSGLLKEAENNLPRLPEGLSIAFQPADLSRPDWAEPLQNHRFDGAVSFAVLHHIPGEALRVSILKTIHRLLKPGARFIHSEWQFQNSPRLMERVQNWSIIGLDGAELEPGDTLLDWRHALPGQQEQKGLRYVHLFSISELERLSADSGFEILESFESDGQGGRLGLYQIWQVK